AWGRFVRNRPRLGRSAIRPRCIRLVGCRGFAPEYGGGFLRGLAEEEFPQPANRGPPVFHEVGHVGVRLEQPANQRGVLLVERFLDAAQHVVELRVGDFEDFGGVSHPTTNQRPPCAAPLAWSRSGRHLAYVLVNGSRRAASWQGQTQARADAAPVTSVGRRGANRGPYPFATGCPPIATLPAGGRPGAGRRRRSRPRATRGNGPARAACGTARTPGRRTSAPSGRSPCDCGRRRRRRRRGLRRGLAGTTAPGRRCRGGSRPARRPPGSSSAG